MKDGTEFLDELKDRVHELYDENHKLKEEVEKINNIINEIKEYFEDLEIFAPSRDIKYDILDIIDGSDKEWNIN